MLRHSTGFYLANKGLDTRTIQAYMGHANINNTVIYTARGGFRGSSRIAFIWKFYFACLALITALLPAFVA